MKDTFHIGDTMHVHIDFPGEYHYNGESYTIINDHIDFWHIVGFIQDTSYFMMNALKHSEVFTDTSIFNVFKHQFSSGNITLLGDIEKMNGRYIVDYAFTLNDTGFITSYFLFFPGVKESAIQLKGDCSVRDEIFRLIIPPGKDDNYDLFSQEDNGVYTEPGHEYIEDYKNRSSYTFYVVE